GRPFTVTSQQGMPFTVTSQQGRLSALTSQQGRLSALTSQQGRLSTLTSQQGRPFSLTSQLKVHLSFSPEYFPWTAMMMRIKQIFILAIFLFHLTTSIEGG
ncbi:unnamed protein product, partial [Coregonus sp. 'balchen']